jgi:hypothetical protein
VLSEVTILTADIASVFPLAASVPVELKDRVSRPDISSVEFMLFLLDSIDALDRIRTNFGTCWHTAGMLVLENPPFPMRRLHIYPIQKVYRPAYLGHQKLDRQLIGFFVADLGASLSHGGGRPITR